MGSLVWMRVVLVDDEPSWRRAPEQSQQVQVWHALLLPKAVQSIMNGLIDIVGSKRVQERERHDQELPTA